MDLLENITTEDLLLVIGRLYTINLILGRDLDRAKEQISQLEAHVSEQHETVRLLREEG